MAAANGLLDLRCLLAACVHLARRGGRIIKEARLEGQLGAHNKKVEGDLRTIAQMAPSEVLTVADGRSQDAIVTSLRSMFPGLRIVGEEGEVPREATPTAFSEVPELADHFEVPEDLRKALTLADTCLWIDPLDGTKEFVLGNLENVTVLIGITVNDTPIAGVIHSPFVGETGRLTYGAVGVGVYGECDPAATAQHEELVVVANARSIEHSRFKAAVERIEPTPRLTATNASGQKFLRVLRGEASAFVLVGGGPSRWDTCAGEALLVASGGKVTNLEGLEYKYVEGGSYDNTEGLIAARVPEIHAQLLGAFSGQDAAMS